MEGVRKLHRCLQIHNLACGEHLTKGKISQNDIIWKVSYTPLDRNKTWYIIHYFQSSSDKGTSTPWTSAPSLIWQDQPDQRLHVSVWQFHLSEGRATSEQKGLLWSDFWSVKRNWLVMWKWEDPQESVNVVSAPSHKSQSSLFRSYFCYFSLQYCHLYIVSLHRMFLEDWSHILSSLCLLVHDVLKTIKYARWEYNTTCIISGWSDNNFC